jgi:hypothetical protein
MVEQKVEQKAFKGNRLLGDRAEQNAVQNV